MPSRPTSILTGGALLVGTTATGLALAPAAGASTLTVSNTSDCATVGCGSLRQAILDANANVGADTITFDPSVTGTIILGSNLPTISEDLTITGPGADRLTIDGSKQYWGFVQDHSAMPPAPIDLTVSGLTMTGMRADSQGGTVMPFGAIALLTGSLTVRDAVVTDSGSTEVYTGGGSECFAPVTGGMTLSGPGLPLTAATIERVAIVDNHSYAAVSPSDASVCGSLVTIADTVTVVDTTVDRNSADIAPGAFLVGVRMSVANSSFDDNEGQLEFGGLVVAAFESATISGTTIDHNRSAYRSGLLDYGTIYSGGTSTATIIVSDSSISSNTNTVGHVSLLSSGTVVVDRTTIVDNGSGPAVPGSEPGALLLTSPSTITSSTIADNRSAGIVLTSFYTTTESVPAAAPGGTRRRPLELLGSRRPTRVQPTPTTPSVTAAHTTIAGNQGPGITYESLATAGTVSVSGMATTAGQVVLDHALLAGNGGATGLDVDIPFTTRFSLVQRPFATHVDQGGNRFDVDPQLQALKWYSARGAVRPILVGSAAWNAGDPGFVPPPGTDQTGAPRVVEIIDMGAYEVQEVGPRFTG